MFGRKSSMKEFAPMGEALKPTERDATQPEPVVPAVVVNPTLSDVPDVASEMLSEVGNASVLPLGSSWQGSLTIDGSVKIEGQVTGEVEAKNMVFVAEGAQVDAKVRAALVVIAGELKGAVLCSERLEIKPTGRVSASLSTKSLVVGEGAFISGQIHVAHSSEPESKATTPHEDGRAAAKPSEVPFKPAAVATKQLERADPP